MAWDFRSKRTVMAITIQPTPGVFNAPGAGDLIGVSAVSNADEIIQAQDPTMTGAMWEAPRIYLGKSSTAGGTVPLRGTAALPAASADVLGRIWQSAGFAEIRIAAAVNANLQAGSTTTGLVLDAGQSAVDDALIGYPVGHANIGTGFQQYSLVTGYNGTTKLASIMDTIVAPAGGTPFVIPAGRIYQLGTLAADPPLLSISIWRDRKRRDYRDCRPSSIGFDLPVANESNQTFPGMDWTMKGIKVAEVDDPALTLPQSILNVPVPALRGGKFMLDRVALGHASMRVGANYETAGASNANQAAGQDGYQLTSGARTCEFDLNDMHVATFDVESRVNNQTQMPAGVTWGGAAFNRFGFLIPQLVLDPLNPGDRNGFVNLTGNAHPYLIDKSMTIAVW